MSKIVVKYEDWMEIAREFYGDSLTTVEYKCPNCGHIQVNSSRWCTSCRNRCPRMNDLYPIQVLFVDLGRENFINAFLFANEKANEKIRKCAIG